MELKQDVQPITFMKNHASELVRRVSEEGRTVLITQNGKAKVVVMDVAEYDRLRTALTMLKLVALGEASIAKGRTYTTGEVLRQAEALVDGRRSGGR